MQTKLSHAGARTSLPIALSPCSAAQLTVGSLCRFPSFSTKPFPYKVKGPKNTVGTTKAKLPKGIAMAKLHASATYSLNLDQG